MSNITIPRDKWEIFSITYATPVKCPRCGCVEYVHVSEYGDNYKKYYPEDMYNFTVTDHCDRCGEQLIVEMDRGKGIDEINVNIWYDVKPKLSDNYTDAMKIFIQTLGSGDCANVIIYRTDGWNEIIEHCCPLDICKEVIFNNFEILGVSENQNTPIKSEEPLRLPEIKAEQIYRIQVRDERSIHVDAKYGKIESYTPVVPTGSLEPRYKVIISKEDMENDAGYIIHCGSFEESLKYLYDNFFVFEKNPF